MWRGAITRTTEKAVGKDNVQKQITREKMKGDHTTIEVPNWKEKYLFSTTDLQDTIENQMI